MSTLFIPAFPLRLVSEANAHEHWRSRQKRAKAQRAAVAFRLLWLLDGAWFKARTARSPLVVTITRIAPRSLDSDNLVGAAKHVRDEIAAWLGIDDRSPLVTWVVEQEKGPPKTHAVRIEIRAAEQGAA